MYRKSGYNGLVGQYNGQDGREKTCGSTWRMAFRKPLALLTGVYKSFIREDFKFVPQKREKWTSRAGEDLRERLEDGFEEPVGLV